MYEAHDAIVFASVEHHLLTTFSAARRFLENEALERIH